jgi:peptidyl-prolyl cis-trans isomerase C
MPQAVARHILVASEAEAMDLKDQIAEGASFGDLAKEHSTCPSGKSGGSLGQFQQGAMVPEFDAVIFGDLPIGEVSDPIKTQFGYHLIEVEKRMD